MNNPLFSDTIIAPATVPGTGAISIVRISGSDCFRFVDAVVQLKNGTVSESEAYTIHYGVVADLDDVLLSVFRAPHSYTGEDSVEISCHASRYIVEELVRRLLEAGCRMAQPGEFTRRAYLNGKMDLAQAEAVADVISSTTAASHRVAYNQLRGGFSSELALLRSELVEMTSLLELELDFSEEDVEFANREQLKALLEEIISKVNTLKDSFRLGNAIKNGVPVAIVGQTNTGKSTLLNALLGEERAIVSDIAGTTRDTIEETLNINGILYRFIDTAGLRKTDETIEKIGIERSYKKIQEASIVIGMLDATTDYESMLSSSKEILDKVDLEQQRLILCINKVDTLTDQGEALLGQLRTDLDNDEIMVICLSAKHKFGLNDLYNTLKHSQPLAHPDATLVTNVRHYEALLHASESLNQVQQGLEMNIPTDLISQDLRQSLHHLGTITGEITTDEVLGTIFSRFCIGK